MRFKLLLKALPDEMRDVERIWFRAGVDTHELGQQLNDWRRCKHKLQTLGDREQMKIPSWELAIATDAARRRSDPCCRSGGSRRSPGVYNGTDGFGAIHSTKQ